MLGDWLRTLSDDYLIAWSNRGLMRRAGKLVAGLEAGAVALEQDAARGEIEGYRQSLAGVGFDQASCTCPATGQCHHLVAFLLALRALAAERDDGPEAASDAVSAAPAAAATPFWRVDDDEALARALGRAHLRRAERWLAEELPIEWEESADELRARIDVETAGGEPVTVRLPAAGGLGASVCSCKAQACPHRALAVLVARRHHGVGEVAAPSLDARQDEALALADAWLLELVGRGLVGLAPLHVDRGEAIATELRQADLPRPARLLARCVADCARIAAGAPARPEALLAPLAELSAVLRALHTTPSPRPLLELAGSHRARYRRAPSLRLLTLGPELWETRTGFRGYSVHFLDRDSGRFLSYSEARGLGQDPDFDPRAALPRGALANRALVELGDAAFTVEDAALSDEGRLTARDKTRVVAVSHAGADAVVAAAGSIEDVRRSLAAALEASPIALPGPQPALVACRLEGAPERDRWEDRWTCTARDAAGERFAVDLERARAERRLAQRHAGVRALFGRARLDGEAVRLQAVVAFTETRYVPLDSESIIRE